MRSAAVIVQCTRGDLALADSPDASSVFIPTERITQIATKVMELGNSIGGQVEAIEGVGAAPPVKALSAKDIQAAVSTFFSKLQVVMAVPTSGKRPCPCVNGSALRVLCLHEYRQLVHKQYLEEVQAQIARNIIHGRRSSLIQSP